MDRLLAILLLIALGLPLAYAVGRRPLLAVMLAPLTGALTCAVAATAMLATGLGTFPRWLAAAMLAQVAGAVPLWLRRRTALPHGSWRDVLCYVLPVIPPALLALDPPISWDSHSIWWLHGGLYTHGAQFARQAMGDPALAASHMDYPPLASAPVAAVWSVFRGYDFGLAQVTSALVTVSAVAALAYAVRAVTGAAPAAVSRLAGVAVALAAWSMYPNLANGQSDGLWTAAWVAAAVLLLFGADPWRRPELPVLLLAVAALTKNEGLVGALIMAVLVTLRDTRRTRRALWVWLPVAAGGGWRLLAGALGARSDVLSPDRISGLFAGDPAATGRIAPTLAHLAGVLATVLVAAMLAAALGRAFLTRRRRAMGLGADGWLWTMAAGYAVSLVLTYVLSDYDLGWYLSTSAARVSLGVALPACASAACWAAVAVGPRASQEGPVDATGREPPVPDGDGGLPPAVAAERHG